MKPASVLGLTDLPRRAAPSASILGLAGILTRAHLAAELGVTLSTIVVWENKGLPALHVGRKVHLYEIKKVLDWARRQQKAA